MVRLTFICVIHISIKGTVTNNEYDLIGCFNYCFHFLFFFRSYLSQAICIGTVHQRPLAPFSLKCLQVLHNIP